jgi:hypothetical protein
LNSFDSLLAPFSLPSEGQEMGAITPAPKNTRKKLRGVVNRAHKKI